MEALEAALTVLREEGEPLQRTRIQDLAGPMRDCAVL